MIEHTRLATDTVDELQRSAFNAAFYELGLRWYWDSERYAALAARPCERERVRCYVQSEHPHLLRAYDADFLVDAVLQAKERALHLISGGVRRGPGFDSADARCTEVGV